MYKNVQVITLQCTFYFMDSTGVDLCNSFELRVRTTEIMAIFQEIGIRGLFTILVTKHEQCVATHGSENAWLRCTMCEKWVPVSWNWKQQFFLIKWLRLIGLSTYRSKSGWQNASNIDVFHISSLMTSIRLVNKIFMTQLNMCSTQTRGHDDIWQAGTICPRERYTMLPKKDDISFW